MINPKVKSIIGDCEVGSFCNNATNVEVTREHGNIMMCSICREHEIKAIERDNAAKATISQFQQASASVQIKQDVFNAKTVAAIELRGAIENNSEIPAESKELAFMEECKTHVLHFKQVVFDLQTSLADAQNSLAMWQTQGQMSAGKVRVEARKGYELFDVNYHPEPGKKIKPVKVPVPHVSAKQTTKDAREAAAKYNLPDYHMVHMWASSNHISHDEAAKQLADFRDKAKAQKN